MKKHNKRKGHKGYASYSYNALERVPPRANPGGQYRAPEASDHNQRQLRSEEARLDFERARCGIDLGGTYW